MTAHMLTLIARKNFLKSIDSLIYVLVFSKASFLPKVFIKK